MHKYVWSSAFLIFPPPCDDSVTHSLTHSLDCTEEPVTAGKDVTVTPGRVHKRNERGETPLHTACIRGDLRLATSLIEQDAEVNATDNAGTSTYM